MHLNFTKGDIVVTNIEQYHEARIIENCLLDKGYEIVYSELEINGDFIRVFSKDDESVKFNYMEM